MVSFTVRMTFKPNDHQHIRELLTNLATASRQEPGCISYIPHFLAEDPSTVVIYEQYAEDAAAEFHRSTPHFKQWAIGGLYQHMLDRHVENLTAIL